MVLYSKKHEFELAFQWNNTVFVTMVTLFFTNSLDHNEDDVKKKIQERRRSAPTYVSQEVCQGYLSILEKY